MTPQEIYDACIASGGTPRLAEALAYRQSPALKTDTVCFDRIGFADPFENYPPPVREQYRAQAKAMGISTEGKRYIGGLANCHDESKSGDFDPEALVDSRGDMVRLAEKRNVNLSGMVNYTARDDYCSGTPVDEIPMDYIDPNIVDRRVEDILEDNPELAPTPRERQELWHKTHEGLKPDISV